MKKNRLLLNVLVFALAIAAAFANGSVVDAAYLSPEVDSGIIVLENVDDIDQLIQSDSDLTVEVVGSNSIAGIHCEGDLTIVGESGATLRIRNVSYSNPHLSDYPGIVAKGHISVQNVSIIDNSHGVAISDVSGSSGGISISNSSVTVNDSDFAKFYGISSIEDISIDNSSVYIKTGYMNVGLFAFGDIKIADSIINIQQDGMYTMASASNINLSRNQKIYNPISSKIGTFRDSRMFAYGNDLRGVLVDGEYVWNDLSIGNNSVCNSVTVIGGSSTYEDGYEGETIQLIADEPEGREFVIWRTSDSIDIKEYHSPKTTFTMPGQPVTVEAIFRDTVVVPADTDEFENVDNLDVTTGNPVHVDPIDTTDSQDDGSSSPDWGNTSATPSNVSSSASTDSTSVSSSNIRTPSSSDSSSSSNRSNSSSADQSSSSQSVIIDSTVTDDAITEVVSNSDGTTSEIILTDSSISTATRDKDGNLTIVAEYELDDGDNLTLSSVDSTSKLVEIPKSITIDGEKFTVTTIGASAFRGNTALAEVVIGSNIKEIESNAFRQCKNLKIIQINGRPSSIGRNAFKGINRKATVKVKANLKNFRIVKRMVKKAGAPVSVKYKRIK